MTTEVLDYTSFVNKRVVLTTRDDEEIEGQVMNASDMGVLIKPKGTSTPRLVMADDIEDVAVLATKPSTLRQRSLDPVTTKNVRRHLVDAHGISLSQVNEIDEDAALERHAELPHEDAGHNHDGRKKKEDATESDDDE